MLASLLLNEPQGTIPSKRRKDEKSGILGGKYIMVGTYMRDLEREEPKNEVAKEIVRRVYKINLPKETKAEVETLIPYRFKAEKPKQKEIDYTELLSNLTAYNRLVDILLAYAREEEEMALIMAMMEIE